MAIPLLAEPYGGRHRWFRWAILGGEHALYWPGFLLSLGVVAALVWTGIWYFRKTEKTFADVI